MSTCYDCKLQLNNDIMGIGVRAALYAQIILAWAMSLIWPDTFVKNSRTAYMTATALLVASLIQWKTQNLSVLDALVVSLMTSMMTIFIVVSGTSRVEAKPTTQTTPVKTSAGPAQTNTPSNVQPPNTPISTPQPAHIRNQNPQQSPPTSSNVPPTSTLPVGSPVTAPQATQATHPAPSGVQQQTAEQQAAAQASDPPEPTLQPRKSTTQWFIRFCFVNLWGGWCFNLWNDPVHFGLEGQRANCTTNYDVTLWVFGVELPAVSPGIRIAALFLVSILYFVAICSLFFTLEDVLDTATGMLGFIGGLFATDSLKRANPAPAAAAKRSLHDDPVLNRIHYFLHISAFGTLIYLVVSIEMTVRHNDKKQETMEWSFGQVIALILLLQQCMDFCSTYIEGRENKQAEREREERERKMAQRPSIITNQQGEDVPMKDLTPSTPNSSLPV